jgi:hypothetical protein
MKKSIILILSLIFILGFSGSAFAAPNTTFIDVPANHWSYDAVNKLVKAGILDGYSDGTFRGDKPISRYEMAIVVARATTKLDKANPENKAIIEKLQAEFKAELDQLGIRLSSVENKVDNVKLSGIISARYENKTNGGVWAEPNGNQQLYWVLEGTMNIHDKWTGHFLGENGYGWGSNTTFDSGTYGPRSNIAGRVWVDGDVGDTHVTLGRRWVGYGMMVYGRESTGAWVDFGKDVKTTLFAAQDDGGTPNYGANINGSLSKNTSVNLVVAGNKTPHNNPAFPMSNWGELSFNTQLNPDWAFAACYAKTNADNYNTTSRVDLTYKSMNLNNPGSYSIFAKYEKIGSNGFFQLNDWWSTFPWEIGGKNGTAKGYVVGFDYCLDKDLDLETVYTSHKMSEAGQADFDRNVFRTFLTFHY